MKGHSLPKHETALVFFAVVFCFSSLVLAKPKTGVEAKKTVSGWLKSSQKPLNPNLGISIANTETYTDAKGRPAYYIVNLVPAGFVIVSADDSIEPIVGFLSEGKYDCNNNNPLGSS